jgi:23S rRNA (uracil1939-C5)-methyltransferase
MKRTVIENLEIIDIADKGRSVGKQGDVVVFTEGAVPGDVIDAEVTRQYHSYIEAKLLVIKKYSPWRTEPFCEHFGTCGGCKWQQLNYETQLRFKEKQVRDAMTRIAKLDNPEIHPIIGSSSIKHYRNKLDFSFSNKRYLLKEEMSLEGEKDLDGLGFHIPGKFNKILDINNCWLQDSLSDQIRNFVRDITKHYKVPYFDIRKQSGMMRGLIVRSTEAGEWMVIVIFKENTPAIIETVMSSVKKEFPQLTSLMYIVNGKKNDTITDQQVHLYHGRAYIIEQMEDLKFIIGPKSFFQTNSTQALKLYQLTREYAALTGNETVYDLYTGTGTIAAFVARSAAKVIGVEYVPEAIEDAMQNAKLNGISNMEFFAGDMKDVLTPEFTSTHGKPDVIITDPPRAGMHELVTKRILEMEPDRIVYVSCNPGTQARDFTLLTEKYDVVKMQPVDMFPHTSHVENVALLKLRQ